MPERDEESAPDFVHYPESELPTFKQPGVEARLIAGSAYGLSKRGEDAFAAVLSACRACSRAPSSKCRANMPSARPISCAAASSMTRAPTRPGSCWCSATATPSLRALEPTTVMLLGGEPLGTRHIWWNFVSSRKERIEQAKADWQAGRFKLPAHDDKEFIPLPHEPKREPEAGADEYASCMLRRHALPSISARQVSKSGPLTPCLWHGIGNLHGRAPCARPCRLLLVAAPHRALLSVPCIRWRAELALGLGPASEPWA